MDPRMNPYASAAATCGYQLRAQDQPPLVYPDEYPIPETPPNAFANAHQYNLRSIHVKHMDELWMVPALVFGRWKSPHDGQLHWFYHTGTGQPDAWQWVPAQWYRELEGYYNPGEWQPRQDNVDNPAKRQREGEERQDDDIVEEAEPGITG